MADQLLVRKTTVSAFYRAWVNMKTRCINKNSHNYSDYGGRGITICDKWISFDGFIDDMFDNYKTGLSLDRINNNKGYSKDNCRWATRSQQALNTRNIEKALRYTFNNQTKTVSEWAKEVGIKRTTLDMRLRSYGWSAEKALGGQIGG